MGNCAAGDSVVYIGTVTSRESRGIYVCRFDATTGALHMVGLAAEIPNPTFLAVHPNGRFLYSVSELRDGGERRDGAVNAFSIGPGTGSLAFLGRQSCQGIGPCHVAVDATGRWVLVANYVSGSVAVLPVREDGSLGEATDVVQHFGSGVNPERQRGPHAHSVTISPDNRFALVADLGLDRIMVYRLDATSGRLLPNDPPWASVEPGSGPRHLAFHPGRPFVYAINEMSSTITAFRWDPSRGALLKLQCISTLPAGFKGSNYAADIHVAPSGAFLYGSNRGHDSLAIFSISGESGTLEPAGHQVTLGRWPRNFAIHPSGRWLVVANAGVNEGREPTSGPQGPTEESVVVMSADPATGRLSPAGRAVSLSVPVCVRFVSAS